MTAVLASLRWAIGQANANGGAETINFDPTVFSAPRTITLNGAELDLSATTGTESIAGPAAGLTIRGGGQSRVFQVDGGVTASISGVTITDGSAGIGGGLYSQGVTSLTDCTVSGNTAANHGGGIDQNGGTIAVTNTYVGSNTVPNGNGGGVYISAGGAASLTGCTIKDNSAGGSYTNGGGLSNYGAVTLTNCTISGNSGANGGGLCNSGGSMSVTNSTVSNNSATWGAGIYSGLSKNGTTKLTDCTVSGNTAKSNGGGVYAGYKSGTTLTDCTVSGNVSSSGKGGGVYSRKSYTTTLIACTISGNAVGNTTAALPPAASGGGLYNGIGCPATLINTIVVGNTVFGFPDDVDGYGSLSGTNNLIGETDNYVEGFANSVSVANLGLAPLGNYGGPTQTMALLPGSPAIGAGTALIGISADQRGQPLDWPRPDIGAYQVSPPGPIILVTAGGQLRGWLSSSLPDTTFQIDVFASSAYNADGSGEEQDFLGSLMVATDATGQVSFAVPFVGPAGLPDITATATTPQGNTTAVSVLRRGVLQVPAQYVRDVPGQPLVFSSASGDAIALQDPDAGPLDPEWDLTLSIAGGTLTLRSTAGLTGSGVGTGYLSYSGTFSALNDALAGLAFTPLPGFHGDTALSLDAESVGAEPTQARVSITDGVFVVTTTADSGPGSLRQAILNSNTVGGTSTIDFAVPGAGVQTIDLSSPLPLITAKVVIDGTTQPGFAGTPLIDVSTMTAGASAGLTVADSNVTVPGQMVDQVAEDTTTGAVLVSQVAPQGVTTRLSLLDVRGLVVDQFSLDTTADALLVAQVHAQGLTTRLSLLDSQKQVLVQSDGLSSSDPDDQIAEHLVSGSYFLRVDSTGGAGTYTLTAKLAPAIPPFQGIPVGQGPAAMAEGDFTGDGKLDLAVLNENYTFNTISVLLGNGDGTFQPQVTYAVGSIASAIVAGDFTGDGRTDLAVANVRRQRPCRCCWATATARSSPRSPTRWGRARTRSWPATSPATVAPTWPSPTPATIPSSGVCWATATARFSPRSPTRSGSYPDAIVAGDFTGDGRTRPGRRQRTATTTMSVLLGNGDGTFQPQVTYAVGSSPDCDRGGRLHRRRPPRPGRRQSASTRPCRCCWATATAPSRPQVTYAAQVATRRRRSWRATSPATAHLDLAVANAAGNDVSVLLGNGDGTFQTPGHLRCRGSSADTRSWRATSTATADRPGRRATPATTHVSVLAGQRRRHVPGPGDQRRGDLARSRSWRATSTATADSTWPSSTTATTPCRCCWATATAPSSPRSPTPWGRTQTRSWRATSTATAAPTWPSPTTALDDTVSVLLGNGDGTFQPQVTYAVGSGPSAHRGGRLQRRRPTRPGRRQRRRQRRLGVCWATATARSSPRSTYAVGIEPERDRGGRLHRRRPHSTWPSPTSRPPIPATVSVLLGNGDGTFQPQVTYAVGRRARRRDRGGRLHRRRPHSTWPSPNGTLWQRRRLGAAGQRRRHLPAPGHLRGRGLSPTAIVAGDFTGDGRTDLAVATTRLHPHGIVSVLLGNGDGTFQPQVTYAVGVEPDAHRGGRLHRRRPH